MATINIRFFTTVLLGMLLTLSGCQSKKENVIVSSSRYDIRNISNESDSLLHAWKYDINNGQYTLQYGYGPDATEIVITDNENNICAAYGSNAGWEEIIRANYGQDKLVGFTHSFNGNYTILGGVEHEDVAAIVDILFNKELGDSLVSYVFRFDNSGDVIEVSDSFSERSIKVPEEYKIVSKICKEVALSGAYGNCFNIKSIICPKEATKDHYDELIYLGYILQEKRNIKRQVFDDKK